MTSNNEKISQFTQVANFQSGDYITGVRSSTNVNFSYSAIYNAINGMGSLKSVGGGSPILNQPVAGVNEIRTITGNKGVNVGLTAQGGIKTELQFTQSTSGEKIIPDLDADNYTVKTLKVTSPLNIASDNESITVGFDDSPLAQTNTVIVSDITDFPAAIGGVITLEDETNYILVQPITTSNRFYLGSNNLVTANNALTPLFTYTGSDVMFTGVDVGFTIRDISINCPSATFLDMKSTGAVGNFFLSSLCIVVSCDAYAVFDNMRTVDVVDGGALLCNNGITLSGAGNWSVFSVTKFNFTFDGAGVGFDLGGATLNTVEIIDPKIDGNLSAVGISGLINSGNITSGNLATVSGGTFNVSTPLLGIDSTDVRWDFQGNNSIADSMSDALIAFTGNALETVISTQSVPVKVNAAWDDDGVSRFERDGTGRLTYIGERNSKLPIDVVATIVFAAGGDKQCQVCIAINGSIVAKTCQQETASSTKAANIKTIWQHNFSTGDYVEVFTSNESSTENIIVTQATMRIN